MGSVRIFFCLTSRLNSTQTTKPNMKKLRQALLCIFPFLLLSNITYGIIKPGESVNVNVFLDSKDIDIAYLKENFQQINYVINREDANVHLLGTSQRTGSGGKEFIFYFIGLNNFEGISDTLYYYSSAENSTTEIREGYTNTIKMGLIRYMAHASQIVNLQFPTTEKPKNNVVVETDKWKSWVFGLNANGRIDGQKTHGSHSLNLSMNATKTTDNLRVEFMASNWSSEDWFEIDAATKITSKQVTRNLTNLTVKSIGKHMAVGLESSLKNSTFNNLDLAISVSPAFEYNVFEYSESSRKQLRFAYYIGYNGNNYHETTIYNKDSETLFKQRLQAIYQVKEEWGSITGSMTGSTYMHDLSKNNLAINTGVDFRVWRGLSITLNANYSIINDQLSLPKGDITLDQQLLQQRQLATTYQYGVSLGFRFTFGSLYNNIVNPRLSTLRFFDGGFGGGGPGGPGFGPGF
jgi:hypothetical protein